MVKRDYQIISDALVISFDVATEDALVAAIKTLVVAPSDSEAWYHWFTGSARLCCFCKDLYLQPILTPKLYHCSSLDFFLPCQRRRRTSQVYALSMSHSFTLMDLKRIEYGQNSEMLILHSTCGLFSTSGSVSTVSRQISY
jgi:hypothetical protein